MLLPAVLLVLACTPKAFLEEASPSCESGFILDGSACVPESCGTGRWGNLTVDAGTVHVDGLAGEGGDGTEEAPFATIQQGLDRAADLSGGLVAVAAGTYAETLSLNADHGGVHLAGRCRDLVILDASVGDEETPGILIDAQYTAVEVSGLTVRDSSYMGIEVDSGDIVARDLAVMGSRHYGIEAVHPVLEGTTDLAIEACLMEGNGSIGLAVGHAETHVTVADLTVRDTQASVEGYFGRGISIEKGAFFSAEGCLIEGNTEFGIAVLDPGTHVTLREIRVTDTLSASEGLGHGITVRGGAVVSMEGAIIEGNRGMGISALDPDTEVRLRDVIVRDTQPDSIGSFGVGVWVEAGAVLLVEGSLIEGNAQTGLVDISPGTQVALRDTTLRGNFGRGIEVNGGATLSAEGCFIAGNVGTGFLALNQATRVTLVDTVVKDTRPDAKKEFGVGIGVGDGASLSAQGCLIDRNAGIGLFAVDPVTQVVLWETTVRDTHPDANGEVGYGIAVQSGARLHAEGGLIEGNTVVGLAASHPGTRVTLRGLTVRDTHLGTDGLGGWGIGADRGALLTAENCLIDRNTKTGLMATDPDTEVTLRGVFVRDTLPDASGEWGWGVEAINAATLTMEACLIEGSTTVGLYAAVPDTQVTLRDTIVRSTQPDANGDFGFGIAVHLGAVLSAESCLIEGNTMIGLHADSMGTDVTLVDSTVRDTQPTVNGQGGMGIAVGNGAVLLAEGSLIDGNTESGVYATNLGTEVTLRDSTVSRTKAGTDRTSSSAYGVTAQVGAQISAFDVVVSSNEGPGLLAIDAGAVVECVGCLIDDNEFAGAVAVRYGALSISDSIIEGTRANANLLGGAGVYAWPWNGEPPTVILTNTLIQDNPIAGVWLIGNGIYELSGNTILGGSGESFGSGSRCGDGVLALQGVAAWDGSSGLLVQDNAIQGASGAGVFLDASSALLSGNVYSDCGVDLVVQNQICDPIQTRYEEAPSRVLCPDYSFPTCSEEFFFVAMPSTPVP